MSERYLSIARAIRAEIDAGTLADGAALPGRLALAERFATTRGTIDRAVRFLVDQGVLHSRRGAGTWVAPRQPTRRVAVVGDAPAVAPPDWAELVRVPYATVAGKAERERLMTHDGVLWYLPGAEIASWVAELPGLPQVVINRDLPGVHCVSTDHRGAVHDLVAERLAAAPDAVPTFLCPETMDSVTVLREAGFVDACRAADRFYERLALPREVDAIIAVLEREIPAGRRPLLLCSCSLSLTGGVMAWARARGLRWGVDAWYSDFDNAYPAHVWGVRVTSFRQDFPSLVTLGLERLHAVIRGEVDAVRDLIAPIRIDGDT